MHARPIVEVLVAHEDRYQRTTLCRLFRKVEGIQCDVVDTNDLDHLEPSDILVLGPRHDLAVRHARDLRIRRWKSVVVCVGAKCEASSEIQSFESLDEDGIAALLDRSKFSAPDPLEFAAHFLRADLDRSWWTSVAVARVVLAIRRTGGNKNAAASFLGLKPQHLRKILEEHHDDALAIALEFGIPRTWVELDASRSGSHAIERRGVAKR